MTLDGPADPARELEQAFYSDGYQFASDLQKGRGADQELLLAVSKLYRVADRFIEMFLQEIAGKQSCHCRKGCSWCCHQAVFGHTHEFRYLKQWMFEHLDAEQMERVRKLASKKHKITLGLPQDERLKHKEACPLLENGTCAAYVARPMACRIYLSMDVDSCKHEYSNPFDKSAFPRLFKLPLQAGRKLNEGFAAGLREAGVTTKEYSLEEGLLF